MLLIVFYIYRINPCKTFGCVRFSRRMWQARLAGEAEGEGEGEGVKITVGVGVGLWRRGKGRGWEVGRARGRGRRREGGEGKERQRGRGGEAGRARGQRERERDVRSPLGLQVACPPQSFTIFAHRIPYVLGSRRRHCPGFWFEARRLVVLGL